MLRAIILPAYVRMVAAAGGNWSSAAAAYFKHISGAVKAKNPPA